MPVLLTLDKIYEVW